MSHSRNTTRSRSRASTPKRFSSAAGDSNLDEELRSVLRKEYDETDIGKDEAIHDVKSILKEVAQDPTAQAMDKTLPRFLSAPRSSGSDDQGLLLEARRSRSKIAAPRHAKLTARPVARGKSGQRLTLQGETLSVPHIPPQTDYEEYATTRPTTSAPLIPVATKRFSSTSVLSEKSSVGSFEDDSFVSVSTTTSSTDRIEVGTDQQEQIDEEELPFTENLLDSKAEDLDEIWKSDIVELTRMKASPKKKVHGSDVLELKYKEPEWPHQLPLHQILAKRPQLTHLVLDGSELRFLRDLGSSLQAMITLSICNCKLRSLDGIYAMPNLRTLIARNNLIKIPSQCSFLAQLNYLDLSSNPIDSLDEFANLIECGELRILKLHDTQVALYPSFNAEIKRLIPQIKEIHPSQYDILEELKQIRKQGQQQQHFRRNQELKKKGSAMPSLAYEVHFINQQKSGIAYQQLPTKEGIEHVTPKTPTGLNEVYMAPKFLEHLEDSIPPPTAQVIEKVLAQEESESETF